MDYKLIKENFERATAKLTEEAAEFTEEEKKALEFLEVAINMFRGGQYGFASDVLEPLAASRNAKVMEINTLAEQLVQELQELEKKIDMLLDGEPEEADPDTEIGEFIGEKLNFKGAMKKITDKLGKNKAEPSSEPEGELIGVGKDLNSPDAREKAMANARQAGHDLYKLQTNQRLTAYVYQDTETGAYEYRYYKLDAPDPGNPNLGF